MKSLDSNILERAVLFTLTLRAWGNRAKGSLEDAQFAGEQLQGGIDNESLAEVEPDKKRLSLSKKLIKSPEYKAVRKKQTEMKKWCIERCMPSFLKDGIFIVSLEHVKEFEVKLAQVRTQLHEELIPAFLRAYPAQVQESREALGTLFVEADYPSEEQLRHSFDISWSWITFSVPDSLPEGIREQEIAKLRERVQDAQREIIASLRANFGELVNHMLDKLKPDPTGKKKVLKDAFIENFHEFFDTFDARNLMDDAELAATVGKARALLNTVSADGLRSSIDLRTSIADSFEEIKAEADKLITEYPSRQFDFEDEEN